MYRILTSLLFCTIASLSFGQFVNNGATVTIQPGATLRVETHFINNSGTVTNNGTLEVQDSFKNNATFFSGTSSIVRFIGTGISPVKTNGAVLNNIELSKTANNIKLIDGMTISNNINFVNDNNKVQLEASNFTLSGSATITSSDNNEYFATNGLGRLVKPVSGNGTYVMEVGDLTNYTPVTNVLTGGTYTAATISARVTDAIHPAKPAAATAFLSRYWSVALTGATSFANAMTATYAASGDAVGTASTIKGANYLSPSWAYSGGTTNGTSTVSRSTTLASTDLTGSVDNFNIGLTAYFQGFMNGALPSMRNVLQLSGVAGATGTQCDTVTLELRNTSSPFGLAHSFKGVLSTTGSITTNFPMLAANSNSYYLAIRHRNGLETWSKNPVNLIAATTYDFSSGVAQAFGDNMKLINGKSCIYSADINTGSQDGNIDLLDYPVWELSNNNFDSGYMKADLNGDGNVDLVDYPIWEVNNNDFISVVKP